MQPYDIENLKKDCSDKLHSTTKADIEYAASLYLKYGLFVNDDNYDIDEIGTECIYQIIYNATHGWVKYLDEEIGKPVVFDFDLWADSLNFTKSMLEALHEDSDANSPSPIMKLCQSVSVAMFRIWYEEITVQNIIDFFDGKPCPNLPDMSDMRKTFLWAMDNNIPCHDMSSYIKYNEERIENQSAEEEISGYRHMAVLRNSFDTYDATFVELGIPQEYLDENRRQLRDVYFGAVAFYELLPPHSNLDILMSEEPEKLIRFYEKFLDLHRYPGIDLDNIEDNENDMRNYYYTIFIFGLHAGEEIAEIDRGNGISDDSIFREAIEQQMEKDKETK